MPKVLPLSAIERKKLAFSKWIKEKKASEDVTDGMIGKKLGITGQAVGQKNKKSQYEYGDLVILFKELNASDEEIIRMMKMEG